MPTRFAKYFYANLIVCAILLGVLCHFVVMIPGEGREKSIVLALAVCTYIATVAGALISWHKLTETVFWPLQQARSVLLATLPGKQPDNVELIKTPIDKLAVEIVEEFRKLQQGQRAIVNFSSDLICSLNDEAKILSLNTNAEKLWLHPNMALVGASILDLAHAADRETLSQYLQLLRADSEREQKPIECRMVAANGRLIDFRWTMEWSPSAKRFYCIGTDITPAKEIERLRAEITAMVSHDLRAPVSSLAYFVDGLIKGQIGSLTEDGKTQVVKLRPNLDQILRLIDQLLDAEQLEAGSLRVQTKVLPVSAFLEASTAMLSASAKSKNIQIVSEETEELVFADFDRCVQVMNNLLSNAIKFSPEASEIKIATSYDDGFVRIEVSDQGQGIAPEFWSVIFDRFKTLESNSPKKHGAGLGLYISKKLIELQQGQMGVYSVPGTGSKFWFSLKQASEDDLPGYLE